MTPIDCCPEEKPTSEGVRIVSNILSEVFWKIRDCIDTVQGQEEMALKVLAFVGSKKSMDEVVEVLLDIEKKLKLKKYQEEKKEESVEKGESDALYDMFE